MTAMRWKNAEQKLLEMHRAQLTEIAALKRWAILAEQRIAALETERQE